jgi:hypothetical protein
VIRRVALLGLLGALTGIAAAAIAFARNPALVIEFGGELPAVGRGFYPPEREGDVAFAWTSSRADLSLKGFDRSGRVRCDFVARALTCDCSRSFRSRPTG